MRSRIPAACVALALVFAAAACHGPDPYKPPIHEIPVDDGPPTPVLKIAFQDLRVEGYAYTQFTCNPLGTTDDYTPRHELTARWDWENDGVWDTGFEELNYRSGFVPSPLPTGAWSAKCEVRDVAGHIVGVADTVSLPSPWFRAPDLVARPATVDTTGSYSETDTVRAGQAFLVMANHLRWTERGTSGRMDVEVLLDGVPVQRTSHPLWPNTHWGTDDASHDQYKTCRLTVAEPGIHTLTVAVDVGDVFAETDETNNTATRTFVVVP